ncbi:MAG: tricarballylate utilization 4Fe-4S protein TcuB, partial [Pseudomonadota bacterium]
GGDVAAEVRQAVLREGALRLEDYWIRRGARAYFEIGYAPPHEFSINVPRAMSTLRQQSYAHLAWPRALGGLFRNHGNKFLVVSVSSLVVLLSLAVWAHGQALLEPHTGVGSFYQVVSHGLMVTVAGGTFLFALFSMLLSAVRYWRELRASSSLAIRPEHVWQACKDAAQLKNLDGGHGQGCQVGDDQPSLWRRRWHHCTMWGFFACFASTSVATLYHYVFGWVAPYAYTSLPVLLGTVGGVGLVIGPIGQLWLKRQMHPAVIDPAAVQLESALLWSLLLVSITGLALLALRDTAWMGTLLIVHLAVVLTFFVMMPYSKFVHGIYRLLALVHFAAERQ